jgi:short-subunit dehydrogenase
LNKKAIIIGATSGIGKELAKILIQNNYYVGITGRRSSLLADLKNENPDKYFVSTFDISDVANIPKHLEALVENLGGLDLLIISSGTGDINDALNFEIEHTTINTNVSGFTAVACWAFNYFLNRKSGHLVGISSIAGIRGSRFAPAYNASKAYQINYLEGLRQKTTRLNLPITVSDIRPGFVDTNMAKGENKFWVAPARKAASQIYDVVNNKREIVYVTKRWQIIAKLLTLMPRFLYERM